MIKSRLTVLSFTLLFAVACGVDDVTQPAVDDLLTTAEAKPQAVACAPKKLKAVQKGKIKSNDCLFGEDQREDLYIADQSDLGQPDLSGATMLSFSAEADFEYIFGASNSDETTFGDPVYGYAASDNWETFSVIGSAPEYKVFFSGQDGTQLGKYTLNTAVEPSVSSCEVGGLVFLEGNVSFSSTITDDNACDGFITEGPNADPENPIPLKYQFWYGKLKAGQEVTFSIDGVDPTQTTVAVAGGRLGTGFFFIDFDDQTGNDTDRSITFTAPTERYYYFEVSGLPGVNTGYNLTFTSN